MMSVIACIIAVYISLMMINAEFRIIMPMFR